MVHPKTQRKISLVDWAKENFSKTSEYDVNALASQLAYFLVVAFFTTLGTLVSVASFFPWIMEQVEYFLMPLFPEIIGDLVEEMLRGIHTSDKIVVLISASLTTFWFSSRCFFVAIRSFNTIYRQERLHTLRVRIISLVFVIGLIFIFIALAGIVLLGQTVSHYLTNEFGFVIRQGLWTVVQYASTTLLLFVLMLTLYYFLPRVKMKIREALPGTFFTTMIWMIITLVFSMYVNNFSSFSWILGSLGGIFLFLIWIFWSCIIFLIGARINYHLWDKNNNKS